MTSGNRGFVDRAFRLLATGLGPFVDRSMKLRHKRRQRWFHEWALKERHEPSMSDPAFLLRVINESWDEVFKGELARSDQRITQELLEFRNRWAHNTPLSFDDTYRVLDSVERLLTAIGAPQAAEAGRSKAEFLKTATEGRKEALVTASVAGLMPWRNVIFPHDDVTKGRYSLAEFAADLYQVYLGREGNATNEYADPVEFFHRTYLTEGLRGLLGVAAQRLGGTGGVPIVDLQTIFGGGKTHAEIALYHLFSGTAIAEFPQEVQELLTSAGLHDLPAVHRAVLAGNELSPGQPVTKPDGTTVRTIWGELAWQLGKAEGYALVAEADRTATNPGGSLRALLQRYSPCLILIDEWVSYARMLIDAEDKELPAGTFETQFTFAQTLTEAVRATPRALLVVSLPVGKGNTAGIGSDVELGGPRGREALRQLQSVVARMESPWRPATAEESYEIVRRRLFQPIDPARVPDREATARAFGELYRRTSSDFPVECRETSYVERIKTAYPIHPELFARLYEDWSTLERFHRTRGVLRLMAAVIHALWDANDRSPLIMPASVPLARAEVASELTRNLEDHWTPVIDREVDGTESLTAKLDQVPNLGRYQASRRVARTVFLGSAALVGSPNRGIDAARIRLGCALPGEQIAVFGDALNRLTGQAIYLYTDGGRYWYGVQPSVTRTAQERADRLRTAALDEIHQEIARQLTKEARERSRAGEFARVHPPDLVGGVSDEQLVRLVLLPPTHPHVRGASYSDAVGAARKILDQDGASLRDYRNMLVFLAADRQRLGELEDGVANHLAWTSISVEAEKGELNLDTHQARLVKAQIGEAAQAVSLRMGQTYQWLLVPFQTRPKSQIELEQLRVEGEGSLAERASRKLTNDGYMYLSFPASLLRQQLDYDLSSLWESGHVTARTLWDAFARYPYLQRLRDIDVLFRTIADGPASSPWEERFAVADAFDESTGRYLGLLAGERAGLVNADTLLVRPDVAAAQLAEDRAPSDVETPVDIDGEHPGPGGKDAGAPSDDDDHLMRRFHGAVILSPERHSRDFGKVAQEVIQHLTGLLGTDVEITVEISAANDQGFPDAIIRAVSENARTLRFSDFGFEEQ